MDKNTNIGILCFVCLTVTQLFSGCAYQTPLPPSTRPALSANDLEERAKRLEDSRLHELTSEVDQKMVSSLLSAYESIRALLEKGELSSHEVEKLEALFKALADIETLYFSNRMGEKVSPTEAIASFSSARKNIFDDYLLGDYQQVIDRCMALEEDYGNAALTTELGLIFALSLGRRGYYKQALQVGEGLVSKLEGRPDIITLQTQILSWHLKLDQKEAALATLDSLIDSLGERQNQFREAQMMLAMEGNKGIADGHGEEHAALPFPEPLRAPQGTIEAVLQKVEQLVSARHYNEANELLITYRTQLQEGPEMDQIDQAIQAVALSEEAYYRENYDKMQERQAILEEAKRLIDEERYEKALAMIDDLRTEGDLTPEAEGLKALATERHINFERSEAAKIFLLAQNTHDLEKKRELLRSSHQILSNLVEKYPSSPLIDRVISHLEKVDTELKKLDRSDN